MSNPKYGYRQFKKMGRLDLIDREMLHFGIPRQISIITDKHVLLERHNSLITVKII